MHNPRDADRRTPVLRLEKATPRRTRVLMNVVIPVKQAGAETRGNASTMERVDAAALVEAMTTSAFGSIVSSAAKQKIDHVAIAEVARQHGDLSFAATLTRGMTARERVIAIASRAQKCLHKKYGSKNKMIAALTACKAMPSVTADNKMIMIGDQMFHTRHGLLLRQVWQLFYPGSEIVVQFFGSLQTSRSDVADPDEFIQFFNDTIGNTFLRRCHANLDLAQNAVLDYINSTK